MKVPGMSLGEDEGNDLDLGGINLKIQQGGLSSDDEDENDFAENEPTEFPCSVCSATFVTRMSLIRHMILHEDDNEQEEEEQEIESLAQVPHIPEQNLLESILKNGSKSVMPSFNGSSSSNGHGQQNVNRGSNGKGNAAGRPIPNLKPLPSLIQMKTQAQQQQEKNFQCQLCGVWFWKKEDLSRHVTRTHGSAKFTCPYCSRNISRRDHLKRHIKNVHPEFCTATEVGPFVNQGAGRPPKQPREMFGLPDDNSNPTKRQRLTNGTSGTSSSSSMNELLGLQNFEAEIPNQIGFINESKIEVDSDTNEDMEDSQFSLEETGNYNQEGIFDDENEEFEAEETVEIKPELQLATMDDEYEEDDDYENELVDASDPTAGPGMVFDDNVNSETYNNEEENGNGISELKPVGGSSERKFKCELCDASFMSKINMQRHMSTHSIARPHKCSVCGKGFLRKEHLTKHLSSVHSGMKYRCQFCRKDISRKDHLLRHIRNCHPQEFMGMSLDMIDSEPQISAVAAVTLSDNPHMRVAALSCDMCSEIFNHIDELMEHQSDAHSDIRKFKCEECPKSFKRKEHLVKHLSTHAAPVDKTYNNSEFNKLFPHLAISQSPVRQAQGKKIVNQANNRGSSVSAPVSASLPCNLCDNSFQQRAHLLQHLKAYHGVTEPERRFTDASFTTATSAPSTPRPMIPITSTKPKQLPLQGSQFQVSQKSIWKPQIRSLLGIRTAIARNDEGSLESLMGLINRGSISLSLSKIEKS